MVVKGSDCLDYDVGMKKGKELIETGENPNFGLLLIIGLNVGLRIGDLLTLTYKDLRKEKFVIKEKKTGKKRKVVANSTVLESIDKMPVDSQFKGYCFLSRKGTVYSPQHVNRLLKKYFDSENVKVSTHSMRKAWGRRYYNKYHDKGGLADLQLQFNHSSPAITLNYIGITQDRLDLMYERIV